ncbi:MAG: AarF/UbiB family protein [Candidatus Peregrinibacteria bacterium]|nr:AarF/UbiB family protein [Candidatus Peregrinibacteria bacterium]
MLEKIQSKLYGVFNIPKGNIRIIDSPQINAYVVRGKSDIYVHMGLLNALALWCERNGKKFTEDKIAMILSHEMTHIEQGTEEKAMDEDEKNSRTYDHQDGKNAEYDADRTGIIRMAQAGYNPREGVEVTAFLKSLGEGLPIFSTHPRNFDRERELQEMVDDVDGFMPNMTKQPIQVPTNLSIKIMENETLAHPGTKLLRAEGLANLEEIMDRSNNIYDVLEVAAVAQTHDLRTVAEHEKDKEYQQVALAKRIVLFNFYKVLSFLYKGSQSSVMYPQASIIQQPLKEDLYFEKEFDYHPQDLISNFDSTKIQKSEVNEVEKTFEGLLKWAEDVNEAIKKLIDKQIQEVNKLKNTSFLTSANIQEIEKLEKSIQSQSEKLAVTEKFTDGGGILIKNALDEVDAETLERIIIQTEIDSGRKKYRYENGIPQDLASKNPQEIAKWCANHGDIFFSDEEMRNKAMVQEIMDLSRMTVETESSYEKFLPKDFEENPELFTVDGRRRHTERILHRASNQSIKGLEDIEMKKASDAIENGQRIPRLEAYTNYGVNAQRILPIFVKKMQKIYEKWGLKDAAKLGKFIAEVIIKMPISGYAPEQLRIILKDMTTEDLKKITAHLPSPFITAESSANSLFLSELDSNNVFNGPCELLYMCLKKDLEEYAKERLSEIGENDAPNPINELSKLVDLLEKSTNGMIYMYMPKIFELVESLHPITAEELQTLIEPFLISSKTDELSIDDRKILFKEVVKHFKGKMPMAELMKFHKGEDTYIVGEFFNSIWDNPMEKNNLSESEQLQFLEAFLSLKFIIGSDKMKNIATEYLMLWRNLHPGESMESPLILVLRKGELEDNYDGKYIKNRTITTADLSPEEMFISQVRNGLSREEVLKIAEYFATKEYYSRNNNVVMDIGCAALAYLNGQAVTKIDGTYLQAFYSPKSFFNTNIGVAENLVNIKKYIPNGEREQEELLIECLKAYNLFDTIDPEFNKDDEVLRKLVETIEDNPDAVFPGGAANLLRPIPNSQSKNSSSIVGDVKFNDAKNYDPKSQKSFLKVFEKNKFIGTRGKLLYSYFKRFGYIDGQIHDDPNDERSKTRHQLGKTGLLLDNKSEPEVNIPLMERVMKIVKLVPEETDFKDDIFEEIETLELKRFGLEIEGHRLVTKGTLSSKAAKELYNFYIFVIPHLVNLDRQQLWSRRADDLYSDFLTDDKENFGHELERIKITYPSASKVRDEALLKLGNKSLVKEPLQARAITALLFENQRRSPKEREKLQQKFLEYFSLIAAKMSRSEKKDFILWTIGAKTEPPLTLRAFGGHHDCSMEGIPDLIFSATSQEREEFFIPLLYGENGVMDPKNSEGKVIFDELLEKSFDKIFPESESGLEGRKTIKTVFNSVFNNYSSFRRSKIFIGMMETLRSDKGSSTFAQRIRMLMEQLGPVFVKAGQVMSEEEKSDGTPLLEPTLRTEFQELKKSVKPFHRIGAFQSLDSMGTFNEDNENRILELGNQLGSASLKVVYRSFTAKGNKEVVKVRRPSIGKHLEEDLYVLEKVVEDLRMAGAEVPLGIDKKIRTWLKEEANFDLEMKNHKEVGSVLEEYNKTRDRYFLPDVQLKVTKLSCNSSEHIQEEFAEGLELVDLMKVKEGKIGLDEVLAEKFGEHKELPKIKLFYETCLSNLDQYRALAFDSMIYQIFNKGRFHADMHAGNIIITPQNEMILIDLGSAGKIEKDRMDAVKKFFHGYIFTSNQILRSFMPKSMNPELLIQSGLKNLVTGNIEARLPEIEAIMKDSTLDGKKQFMKIMEIISTDEFVVDEGFFKFIKAMATGSYLSSGLDMQALQSIVRNAPVE